MGQVCSTNTLTTEKKTNTALIFMSHSNEPLKGDKTFDLHTEGHERSPLHLISKHESPIFHFYMCPLYSSKYQVLLQFMLLLCIIHNMDKSLWRHTVVLLLVLVPSRVRDMKKQEFGRHRCKKSLVKIEHYRKQGRKPNTEKVQTELCHSNAKKSTENKRSERIQDGEGNTRATRNVLAKKVTNNNGESREKRN